MIHAFKESKVFIIGMSATEGYVKLVLNIHQKSNPNGGTRNYGWPDRSYISRVMGELAGAGIFGKYEESDEALDEGNRKVYINRKLYDSLPNPYE